MGDESPHRRDVLRSGVAAGVVWLGWTTGRGLAQDGTATTQEETTTQGETTEPPEGTTTAQSRQGRYAFSYGLQRGDRFVVRFRPSDSAGEPVTETIPPNCLDGGDARRYQVFVVRAYRGSIDLGYRDLLVPPAATGTQTPDATQTQTPDATETETGTTTQGTTPGGDETTSAGETATPEATNATEETTVAEETTTPGETTTQTGESALPEIRRGEWYRVASSVRCSGLNRLTLETADQPETTTGPQATTTEG